MDKGKLSALSRDMLIEHAEELGVRRARFLTRLELVDEILLAESKKEGDKRGLTRGFVGVARDLLARLVERGLHLPDAAERIRGASLPPRPRAHASSIPTVTLAEIYASQGHLPRAVETLQRLLATEPEHEEAVRMLAELVEALETSRRAPERAQAPDETPEHSSEVEGASISPDSTATPPPAEDQPSARQESPSQAAPATPDAELAPVETPPSKELSVATEPPAAEPPAAEPPAAEPPAAEPPAAEPRSMLDDAPLPPRYDVNECVALPVDPHTVFVYWEIRAQTLARVTERGGEGTIVLRIALLEPRWDGPTYSTFDRDVHANLGEYFVRDLPEGAVVRVAVGVRTADGSFTPLAHSELYEAVFNAPETPALLAWSPEGAQPVTRVGREAAFFAEALHASQSGEYKQLALKYGASALASWRDEHKLEPLGSSRRP